MQQVYSFGVGGKMHPAVANISLLFHQSAGFEILRLLCCHLLGANDRERCLSCFSLGVLPRPLNKNFEAALLPSGPIYNSRYQGEPAAIGNCSGGGSVLFTL